MPLSTAIVGRDIGEITTPITLRRVMAYAASVGDYNMRYFDDTRPEPVVAPPAFGVVLDFPLHEPMSAMLGLSDDELLHQVHATQDMLFHRLVRVGDQLTTRGLFVGAEQRSPGAYLLVRFDTAAADGAPVLTTYFGLLFRGVPCAGAAQWVDRPPELPALTNGEPGDWSVPVSIPWGLPHVYTECAQLYLGIHTERSTAKAVGLPDIILHGTATLAIAARELVDRHCGQPAIKDGVALLRDR
jgi:acyl dehydratase